MDAAGLTFIGASNGEKGQSTNFIDPDQIPKTMADHIAFCRDFLQPLGCDHWKINMGARPAGGPSEEQLKRLANTLNELGAKTIAMGVRLSPHPHIWGPLEREKDMRWVMDHTDPKYVWMTADTGHLVLGGGDPVQIISDYFPRVSEIHLKDTYAKYRGNTETPDPGDAQAGIGLSQSGRRRRRLPGRVRRAAQEALQGLGDLRRGRPAQGR